MPNRPHFTMNASGFEAARAVSSAARNVVVVVVVNRPVQGGEGKL